MGGAFGYDARMKTLKIAQLIGVLILLIGVVIRTGAGELYGTPIALLGLLIFAAARITGWIRSDKP